MRARRRQVRSHLPDLLVALLRLEELDEGVAHRASAVVQVLELPVLGLIIARFRGRPHDGAHPTGGAARLLTASASSGAVHGAVTENEPARADIADTA
jgi:hypothetical protein